MSAGQALPQDQALRHRADRAHGFKGYVSFFEFEDVFEPATGATCKHAVPLSSGSSGTRRCGKDVVWRWRAMSAEYCDDHAGQVWVGMGERRSPAVESWGPLLGSAEVSGSVAGLELTNGRVLRGAVALVDERWLELTEAGGRVVLVDRAAVATCWTESE